MKKILLLILLLSPFYSVSAVKIDTNFCRYKFNTNIISTNENVTSFNVNESWDSSKYDYEIKKMTHLLNKLVDLVWIKKLDNLLNKKELRIIFPWIKPTNFNNLMSNYYLNNNVKWKDIFPNQKVYNYSIGFTLEKAKTVEFEISFVDDTKNCIFNDYNNFERSAEFNILDNSALPYFTVINANNNNIKPVFYQVTKKYNLDGENIYFIHNKMKISFYANAWKNNLKIYLVQNKKDGHSLINTKH